MVLNLYPIQWHLVVQLGSQWKMVCLIMTVDERHTGKQTAFDVLEEMMRILQASVKETVVIDSV